MKNWNAFLFVRHGWLLNREKENVFNCQHETEMNKQFLLQSLDRLIYSMIMMDKRL